MQLTIYHNPRCRKSREALQYLEDKGVTPKIVRYLETPLEKGEMETLVQQLGGHTEGLIRKNESLWKSEYKDKLLTTIQQIQLLVDHPKLMERPIISNGKKAVIGRPIEKLHQFLK